MSNIHVSKLNELTNIEHLTIEPHVHRLGEGIIQYACDFNT